MQTIDPVTLYIFHHRKHLVAIAIGHWPPDPGVAWDAITRVPIVSNDRPPSWRSFTCHQTEPLSRALQRSRWPETEKSAGGAETC